jgi:hypothetical protein
MSRASTSTASLAGVISIPRSSRLAQPARAASPASMALHLPRVSVALRKHKVGSTSTIAAGNRRALPTPGTEGARDRGHVRSALDGCVFGAHSREVGPACRASLREELYDVSTYPVRRSFLLGRLAASLSAASLARLAVGHSRWVSAAVRFRPQLSRSVRSRAIDSLRPEIKPCLVRLGCPRALAQR